MKRRYMHDCDHCRFIGVVWSPRLDALCDLYRTCDGTGFVLRYGAEEKYACSADASLVIYLTEADHE